ncbi:hypothetical protein BH24CHL4_BH24CHL4_03580 [soil metagenome]
MGTPPSMLNQALAFANRRGHRQTADDAALSQYAKICVSYSMI